MEKNLLLSHNLFQHLLGILKIGINLQSLFVPSDGFIPHFFVEVEFADAVVEIGDLGI